MFLVSCRSMDKSGIGLDPVTGEQLYDLDLLGFGSASEAMTNGTNLDGTPCFDSEGRFNGYKIAPFSSYTNTKDDADPVLQYWNYETQSWGG